MFVNSCFMFAWRKTVVGLDIDDRSIEAAELRRSGKKAKIVSLGRMNLDRGIVENGRIKQLGPLVSAVRETLAKAKPAKIKNRRIVLGLPINQTYTSLAKIPALDMSERENGLRTEAEHTIPVTGSDLLLLSDRLAASAKAEEYLLIGVSRQVVKEWRELLVKLKAESTGLDLEIYSLFRDLAVERDKVVCLVDLGAETTNVMIFDQGSVQYTCSLQLAGDHFTQAVADYFQLDFNIAEVKKIRLGLNRQLYPVLVDKLDEISLEIKRVLAFYQKKSSQAVSEVVLVGGGSRLKGLAYYFQDHLPLPVRLGQAKSVTGDYPEYIGALGFALRQLFKDKWQNQPWIDFRLLDGRKTGYIAASISSETTNTAPAAAASAPVAIPTASASAVKSKLPPPVPEEQLEAEEPEPTHWSGATGAATAMTKRLSLEKKLLVGVFVIGLVMLFFAFKYRDSQRAVKTVNHNDQTAVERQTEDFPFRVPIALQSAAGQSAASGRIVEDTVTAANTYEEAVNLSRRNVSGSLAGGESVWQQPMNEIIPSTVFKPPVAFRWLVFSDKEVLSLAMSAIKTLDTDNIPFDFVSWSKDTVDKTGDLNTVYLSGRLTVSVDKIFAQALTVSSTPSLVTNTSSSPGTTASTVTTTATTVAGRVTVKPTETGWLNVRAGQGIDYPVIAKVNPGETYELVSRSGTWAQIKLSDGQVGWVAGRYLQ